MESTFAKKTDEKKEAQAPPAALPDASLSLQGELGATAGMPLFLQRSAENRGSAAAGDDRKPGLATAALRQAGRRGAQLPASLRRTLEHGLQTDLSRVRIHTDSEAAQAARDLNARAFAHGQDIYFNHGQYDPVSSAGRQLLAHELTCHERLNDARAYNGSPEQADARA